MPWGSKGVDGWFLPTLPPHQAPLCSSSALALAEPRWVSILRKQEPRLGGRGGPGPVWDRPCRERSATSQLVFLSEGGAVGIQGPVLTWWLEGVVKPWAEQGPRAATHAPEDLTGRAGEITDSSSPRKSKAFPSVQPGNCCRTSRGSNCCSPVVCLGFSAQ